MSSDAELKKGSTPILILAVLADGPRHGYAIAREITRRSADALSVGEGALYPALRALERQELVTSRWEMPVSGPARKIYDLTDAGRAHLAAQVDAWRNLTEAISKVIGGNPHVQPT